MTTNEEVRDTGLIYISHFIGTWYKWGGDDPNAFDCSGFASEFLQATGKLHRGERLTAQGIWDRFSPICSVPNPYRGCLVLFNSPDDINKIIHVEICLNEYQSIGASGGGSNTLTVQDAINQNAFIKVRPITSRANIKGYIDPFLNAIEGGIQ